MRYLCPVPKSLAAAFLASALWLPPAARADGPVARPLDAEEMLPGLPGAEAGIVFRVPGNAMLLLEDGPAAAGDFSVVLVTDAGASVEQFFEAAGEDGAPHVAIVSVFIGDLVYAQAAQCTPSEAGDGSLTCVAGGDGGSFALDMFIAAPNLALGIEQPLKLADDPADPGAGTKTLVPAGDGQGWMLVLPYAE